MRSLCGVQMVSSPFVFIMDVLLDVSVLTSFSCNWTKADSNGLALM